MSKKKKIAIGVGFVALIAIIGIVAGVLNHKETQAGGKEFQIEIVSERDDYSETETCSSDKEYLGEFLREYEACEWQDTEYGLYITGFDGMEEDLDEQYWWCVSVNGEDSTVGADEIPLEDGSVYTFTLKQGW